MVRNRLAMTLILLGISGFAWGAEDMGNMTLEEHMKMMKHPAETTSGAMEHAHHEHGKGSWMVEYEFMRMNMKGLMNGKHEFTAQEVYALGPNMMAPEEMTMDMHMLMIMYGVTSRFSAMLELNYVHNEMAMSMQGMTGLSTMHIQGIGDTVVTGMFKLNPHWMLNAGLVLPTGSIDEEGHAMHSMTAHAHGPYYMQPGSGTFGLKPSATVKYDVGAFNVGAQGSYTYRLGYNDMHYNLGDRADGETWIKYNGLPHTQLSFGLAGHYLAKVDAKPNSHLLTMLGDMPDYDPANTGSFRMEAVLGVEGHYKNVSAGLEYGLPVYEIMRGIQLETHSVIGVGLHAVF